MTFKYKTAMDHKVERKSSLIALETKFKEDLKNINFQRQDYLVLLKIRPNLAGFTLFQL